MRREKQNFLRQRRTRTSFSLYIGIWTRTIGKEAFPSSASSSNGCHLNRFSGVRRKSLTTVITTPMYTHSTNNRVVITKQISTAMLSTGAINGTLKALISPHISTSCSHTKSPASEIAPERFIAGESIHGYFAAVGRRGAFSAEESKAASFNSV